MNEFFPNSVTAGRNTVLLTSTKKMVPIRPPGFLQFSYPFPTGPPNRSERLCKSVPTRSYRVPIILLRAFQKQEPPQEIYRKKKTDFFPKKGNMPQEHGHVTQHRRHRKNDATSKKKVDHKPSFFS